MLISVPAGTEMFQFPAFALTGLWIQPAVKGDESLRVSPFGNLRINRLFAPPRSLSQLDRVLHRFPEPRHPPCALCCLTSISSAPPPPTCATAKSLLVGAPVAWVCRRPPIETDRAQERSLPTIACQRPTRASSSPSPACFSTALKQPGQRRYYLCFTTPGAGCPRNNPSVLKSSSTSGQWMPSGPANSHF